MQQGECLDEDVGVKQEVFAIVFDLRQYLLGQFMICIASIGNGVKRRRVEKNHQRFF